MRRLDLAVPEPVSDQVDLVEHFELEAGIVRIVVAGAADLQDHAASTLLGEREDRAFALGVRSDVIATGTVAALAANVGEPRSALGEATGLAKSRRVTLLAVLVLGLVLSLEGGPGMGVWALQPALVLGA